MANPNPLGEDASPPLPPLLATFLFSRIKPGAADSVAEAVLRVAREKYETGSAEGKKE